MSHNLESRAARVSVVTGISIVLSVVMQLASVSVCVKFWGQQTYGEWLTLNAAFLLIRSVDAGFVSFVGNKFNYLYHVDRDALRVHLSSALFGTAALGALQFLFAVAVVVHEPLAQWMGIGTLGISDRIGLLVLLGSWIAGGCYLGLVQRLQVPAGLMYQAAWASVALQVGQLGALIWAAMDRMSILEASILSALVQVVVYVASAAYVARKLPDFYPWWRGRKAAVGFVDLLHSGAVSAGSFIQQATTNGIVLVAAVVGGAASVPLFTTVRTLANLWTTVTNALTAPLSPEVIRFRANGEGEKLRLVVETHWVLVGGFVNLSVLVAYPFVPLIYATWTHGMPLDVRLLNFLLGALVVTNVGALMSVHLSGMNRLGLTLGTAVLRCVLTLGVGAISFSRLGIAGFGLGVLAGEVAVLVITWLAFRAELEYLSTPGHRLGIGPAAVGAGSLLLFLFATSSGWLPLQVAFALAACGVAASVAWGWKRLPCQIHDRLKQLVMRRRKTRPVINESLAKAK